MYSVQQSLTDLIMLCKHIILLRLLSLPLAYRRSLWQNWDLMADMQVPLTNNHATTINYVYKQTNKQYNKQNFRSKINSLAYTVDKPKILAQLLVSYT